MDWKWASSIPESLIGRKLRNKYHLYVIHFLRIIFESLSAFPRSMLIQFSLVTKWRPVLLHFLRLLWTMTKPAETGAEVATDYNCGWVLTLSHFLTLLSPRLQSVSLTSSNIHSMDSFKCRKSIYTQEMLKSISKCISYQYYKSEIFWFANDIFYSKFCIHLKYNK